MRASLVDPGRLIGGGRRRVRDMTEVRDGELPGGARSHLQRRVREYLVAAGYDPAS